MLRDRAAFLVLLVTVFVLVYASAGAADTKSDLDAARQRYADAQAAANRVAGDLDVEEGRSAELSDDIAKLQGRITTTRRQERQLVAVVRARARLAYTRASASHLSVALDASSPLELARRTQLLDLANHKDNLAVKRLAALRSDLRDQRASLRQQREDAKKQRAELAGKSEEIQARLAAAADARDALIKQLEAEQATAAEQAAAAQAKAELARLLLAQAAAPRPVQAAASPVATTQAPAPTPVGGSPGQIVPNPNGGAFQCPVFGSSYTDSYGPRGSGFHYGIDMFVPTGTRLFAVMAGTVRYVPDEGAGGNTVYLSAVDGNVYFYAHLSSFVGGPRSVAQGEVVGLSGMTGNAAAPHLHFEIRIGGANGERIDPYPTLRAAGC
jgi:murein DD-endopeptidase MepM/ murein hydrolase activator NlpD